MRLMCYENKIDVMRIIHEYLNDCTMNLHENESIRSANIRIAKTSCPDFRIVSHLP